MVGIDTHFHCCKCQFSGVVDLGITSFVNYKGEKLALRSCPKCYSKIVFKIAEVIDNKLGSSRLNAEGVILKEKIVNIISSNLEILKNREEEIHNFILDKLKEIYTEGYLRQNAYEVQTILEYVLANKLYTESYIFEEIKNDCEDAGCICF